MKIRRIGRMHKRWSLCYIPSACFIGVRYNYVSESWEICLVPTIMLRWWPRV